MVRLECLSIQSLAVTLVRTKTFVSLLASRNAGVTALTPR